MLDNILFFGLTLLFLYKVFWSVGTLKVAAAQHEPEGSHTQWNRATKFFYVLHVAFNDSKSLLVSPTE